MYESFFGLSGPPFRLTPDHSFLFNGKGYREAYSALRAGLAAGAKVMVLTGEVGAGKTTLLQAFLASVDPLGMRTVHVSAARLDAGMLSERLFQALDVPSQRDALTGRDALLVALATGPLTTLLVIDEAQHLVPSALDLLEALVDAKAPALGRLQICLVGQPELRILLNTAQRGRLRELIDVGRHLGPLEQGEIRLYVEHRLHRAGWRGNPEFEDAAFAEIFIFTAGNPRRVNHLCTSLLLCACSNKQKRIDATAVTRAAAAMREDLLQGEADVLDLGAHFKHRPSMTEAFAPDIPGFEHATSPGNPQPWPCQGCGRLNPPTAVTCANCKAARPRPVSPAGAPGATIPPSEDTATAPPEAVYSQAAASAPATDDPASWKNSDATSPGAAGKAGPVHTDLKDLTRQHVSATSRRPRAIVASVASVAAAVALLAYYVHQRNLTPSLSQEELRNTAVNRTVSPASSETAPDSVRHGGGFVSPAAPIEQTVAASSPNQSMGARRASAAATKASRDGDNLYGPATDETTSAMGAREPAVAASQTPVQTTPVPCSGPAFALGLCGAESSSTRRP